MTLPALIQQLRAARPDSLTELREAIAVVAEAVVANDGETTHVRHVAVLRSEENRQLRTDVDRLTRELAIRQRDTARAEAQRLTTDRDRLAAEVKTIAETTERETVERIAAFLDAESDRIVRRTWTSDIGTVQLRVTAKAIREGKWKP